MALTPLEDLDWLNGVGDRFEDAWVEGGRPRIEDFLAGSDGPRRERLLAHLVGVELALRRQRGERPQPEEYEARFPADLGLIGALWEAETIPTGTTFPDPFPEEFRVLRFLGVGGFGEVWLAQDLNLPRFVALKTLRLRHDSPDRDRALEVLRNEAAQLTHVRHPNIVDVYAWRTAGSAHYLVLQYVPGGSLADRLKNEGAIDWRRAARYVADVGEGLLPVHDFGIVHRDIKPANILWDPESDEAFLTDFGVAAFMAANGGVAGTPPYMAPEAFQGRVSPALDVYSLAVTFYQLLTDRLPFAGPGTADYLNQIARGLPDPDPRGAGIPAPLERLIRSGLTADPTRRPGLRALVSDLRATLNRLLADDLMSRPDAGGKPSPVDLRLVLRRRSATGVDEPLGVTPVQDQDRDSVRDTSNVPPTPSRVRVRTGDCLSIDVSADRAGYLTVFNIGPTGNLNVLHPEDLNASATLVAADDPIRIAAIELTPPAGDERLFAVWSRRPLPLDREQLLSVAERGKPFQPRSYCATRDLKRVKESVQHLGPLDCHAIVIELDHRAEDSRA